MQHGPAASDPLCTREAVRALKTMERMASQNCLVEVIMDFKVG